MKLNKLYAYLLLLLVILFSCGVSTIEGMGNGNDPHEKSVTKTLHNKDGPSDEVTDEQKHLGGETDEHGCHS